jgi:hypothetical protein
MPSLPRVQKRHLASGLAAAATLAFAPAAAVQADETSKTPALQQGETWWYSQRLDSVLAFRPCPETTLCARVVWYAPHDRRLSDLFNPANRNRTPVNMCNYTFRASFERAGANRWNGRMQVPNRNWNVSIRLDAVDANTLRLHARNGILFSTENLSRVTVGDARYTTCRPNL